MAAWGLESGMVAGARRDGCFRAIVWVREASKTCVVGGLIGIGLPT